MAYLSDTKPTSIGRSPLLLPVEPNKAALLREARGSAPFYDHRLKLWVVLDHDQVSELVLDDRLEVPEIGPAVAAVERRFSVSLPHLRWVAGELPLVLNGAAHDRARSGLAKLLSAERKAGGAWREPVAQLTRSAFATGGPVEAVRGLLLPVINAVFGALTRVDVSFEPLALTRVFDHYAGFRHLLATDALIGTLRGRLAEAGVPPDSIGRHIALVIFGRDALLSSMGDGLIDFALNCRGWRLDDPAVKPARLFGGVAVGERLVRTTFTFAGVTFEEGQRVRLYFLGFNHVESETERLAIFGAGDHSCLGRALALDVWSVVVAEMRKVPLTLSSVAYAYERNSMFTMPRSINLELASP